MISAVHDVPMEAVARALGYSGAVGQSPFALLRGQQFERSLFRDDAVRLRRALITQKVLPANAAGFVDFRMSRNDGPYPNLDASRAAFLQRLAAFAKTVGDARLQLPTILAGPTLMVPGKAILPDGLFAIDVLTVHPQPRPAPIVLRVGEVKVYPDRGGFTDATELAATRAQAGLYVHALRVELQQSKLAQHFAVADDGFLVLTRPSFNLPSVRGAEDLQHQAERAAVMFDRVHRIAERLLPPDSAADDDIPAQRRQAVLDAPRQYADGCLSFCELAPHCQQTALAQGLPAALGDDLARFLGPITLHRALELLHGAAAEGDVEHDLLARIA
ncbi:MAG: hypothetical protein Q8S73_22870 [Deltaproteobacteria bacterium]|nr:hypothetical protein [Myxococcales bacterium]MDP3216972.1 hypothetical protein [Deltaproteobacteria bacterium]